jgi:hypothetical protein
MNLMILFQQYQRIHMVQEIALLAARQIEKQSADLLDLAQKESENERDYHPDRTDRKDPRDPGRS